MRDRLPIRVQLRYELIRRRLAVTGMPDTRSERIQRMRPVVVRIADEQFVADLLDEQVLRPSQRLELAIQHAARMSLRRSFRNPTQRFIPSFRRNESQPKATISQPRK